jgi:hypothetical protein
MTTRLSRALPLCLVCLLSALFGAACSRAVETTAPGCASAEPGAQPIDTDVMAFLSAARALHHEADLKEDAKDLRGAIAAMQRLVALPVPHPGTRVVEVEEVLADAYARMADLEVRAGDVDGALRDSQAGLDHAQDPTYFRGHLLEVEGVAEKSRAGALADAGRAAEAEQAKQRAIVLLHDAVKVQEQVIDKSLGDAGGSK